MDDALLAELSDRAAIADVLVGYANCLDRDMSRWDDVFAPDAVLDYSAAGGIVASRDEMRSFMLDAHSSALATQHLVSNMEIRVDGNSAESETAVRAMIVRPGSRAHLVEITDLVAIYRDQLARRPEGWRIRHRAASMQWREYRHAALNADPALAGGRAWLPGVRRDPGRTGVTPG
jgi:SnoaL-like domain